LPRVRLGSMMSRYILQLNTYTAKHMQQGAENISSYPLSKSR
jgi:hypothetical protein